MAKSRTPRRPRSQSSAARRNVSAKRWGAIQLFAMDVDGVLTDGSVFIGANGFELKRFSILDGLGLARLRDRGIALAWISGRASPASTSRATELRIPHLIQGRVDKVTALQELAAQLGLSAENICYMGDDEIDTAAIAWAGIGVAPPGAMPEPLAAADYVTRRAAGNGAVREVCDLIFHQLPGK